LSTVISTRAKVPLSPTTPARNSISWISSSGGDELIVCLRVVTPVISWSVDVPVIENVESQNVSLWPFSEAKSIPFCSSVSVKEWQKVKIRSSSSHEHSTVHGGSGALTVRVQVPLMSNSSSSPSSGV
jgi:hypothetical protein